MHNHAYVYYKMVPLLLFNEDLNVCLLLIGNSFKNFLF